MNSWHDLLAHQQRVLVLGPGGTGKTVLANRICYEIAAARDSTSRSYDVGFTAPLRQRGDHEQSLVGLVADAVRAQYRLDLLHETLDMLLRDARTVVIFDGLDEIPHSSRSQVIRDISAFCAAYPSARVVVTSRPGPNIAAFSAMKFQPYEVAPLANSDITAYIERWGAVAKTAPAE